MVRITDSYAIRVGAYHNLHTIRRLNLPEIREKGYFEAPECWQKIYLFYFVYLFIFIFLFIFF